MRTALAEANFVAATCANNFCLSLNPAAGLGLQNNKNAKSAASDGAKVLAVETMDLITPVPKVLSIEIHLRLLQITQLAGF